MRVYVCTYRHHPEGKEPDERGQNPEAGTANGRCGESAEELTVLYIYFSLSLPDPSLSTGSVPPQAGLWAVGS